ncbi:MAG: hypothetical protein LQ338_003388 [Usnochroma carphineum]|nr:MAG: hypothetical protein LQ338_003388 [Usnochroma carphineum]
MAPRGLDTINHVHASTNSALLEDPFLTKMDKRPATSIPDSAFTRQAEPAGDIDNGTTLVASSGIFGNAPRYPRPSSSVKMPPSPASRKPGATLNIRNALPRSSRPHRPTFQEALGRSSTLQRASNSYLNAGAAPFRPRPTSPASQEADKRSFTHPFSTQDLPGLGNYAVQGRRDPEGSDLGEQDLDQKTFIPLESKKSSKQLWQFSESPAKSARSARRPRLAVPLDDARFATPQATSQHWPLTQDKRRLAYSDEPSFYQHSTLPARTTTPSPIGTTGTTELDLSYWKHVQPLPGGYVLQTFHPLTSASSSVPRLVENNSESLCFPQSNRAPHECQNENRTLNHMSQGPFQGDQNGDTSQATVFDHYTPTPSIPSQSHSAAPPQINPYSQEGNAMGSGAYFPGSSNYPQQLQHHLYAALPPHRDLSHLNQRTAKDFFIPENLRQTLARKTEASLMTISSYRLNEASSEHAIRNVGQNWKRVRNANVVTVHLAFTNSSFGDSSLIFVTDFHPLAETLAQRHFSPPSRFSNRYATALVPETTLWGYIVQIANALKAIHSAGLAARVLDPSKILLTGENRIRLNACAILDVVQADVPHPLADNQRLDLYLFGRLILALGSNNTSQHIQGKALDAFSRSYTPRLKEVTTWLLDHVSPQRNEGIDNLLTQIAGDAVTAFDNSLHQDDALESALARELENSRIVRLMTKMNFINERPEYEHDRQWAEHGNRYCIKLFRDYVFHPVDAQGNPLLDMGHVVSCLNKLDAGIEEKIMLTTRDEETVIYVSYKELKACIEGAWQDLMRRAA